MVLNQNSYFLKLFLCCEASCFPKTVPHEVRTAEQNLCHVFVRRHVVSALWRGRVFGRLLSVSFILCLGDRGRTATFKWLVPAIREKDSGDQQRKQGPFAPIDLQKLCRLWLHKKGVQGVCSSRLLIQMSRQWHRIKICMWLAKVFTVTAWVFHVVVLKWLYTNTHSVVHT